MPLINLNDLVFFRYCIGYQEYMFDRTSHYCRCVGKVKTINSTNGEITVSPFNIIDVDPANIPFTEHYEPISSSTSELIVPSSNYMQLALIPINFKYSPGMNKDEYQNEQKFGDLAFSSERHHREIIPLIAVSAGKFVETTEAPSEKCAISVSPPPPSPRPKLTLGKTYKLEKKVLGKLLSQKNKDSKCIYTFEQFNETTTKFDLIIETLEEFVGMKIITLNCEGEKVVLDGTK